MKTATIHFDGGHFFFADPTTQTEIQSGFDTLDAAIRAAHRDNRVVVGVFQTRGGVKEKKR